MSNASVPVHNPSPYLRRYRLPTINSSSTVAAYEELLSPVDNCAKLALISTLNLQNKQFSFSKPMTPPTTVFINHHDQLNNDQTNSKKADTVPYNNQSAHEENSMNYRTSSRTATDFEFRLVANELEKKCREYDMIANMAMDKNCDSMM